MNIMGMPETTMLLWSVVLGLVQLVLATAAAGTTRTPAYNMSPRDEPAPPLSVTAARLGRAFTNFMETFVFFATAVIVLALLHREDHISAIGAQLYFWARLVYVPAYGLGIKVVRSLLWTISLIGLVMVLLAAFGVA
jgi:uncharacterized MAPEG superfamily protein